MIDVERMEDCMSKHDYNYVLLLFVACLVLGALGLFSIGALIMFLTAFM